MALVQELQVARVDLEGLVGGVTDDVAVGDVVGPSCAAVGFAREGSSFGAGLKTSVSDEDHG